MGNFFSKEIRNDWNEIEKTRMECRSFLEKQKLSDNIIDAVSMVVSELLENSLKYGAFSKAETVHCTITVGDDEITVEVKSPVDRKNDQYFRKLDQTIQWIRGYQNPFEAYIEKLKEASLKSFEDRESGLGLVRIAYEGQSILDFYVNEKNIIAISAVYQF